MWTFLVRFILRNRLVNLIIILALTVLMGIRATKVEMSYEYIQVLPQSDSTFVKYNEFKELFGQDGSVLFLGVKDKRLKELEHFGYWYDLSERILKVKGVNEQLSVPRLYNFHKNDSLKKFDFLPVLSRKPESQEELDSILSVVGDLPFFEGFLFNSESGASIMALTLDKEAIDSERRFKLLRDIEHEVNIFKEESGMEVHMSGMPYIRTLTMKKVKQELFLFVVMALIVASVFLFLFFRSVKAVVFPLFIVGIGVIWVLGTLTILDFQVTVLTGILPSLLIVIGVENCIFLLNKYHQEYKDHGNKVKALSRVVQRVGYATLLTNVTTAVGFAAFIVTGNKALVEFGIVASVNIVIVFILSVFLIPIFFSYLSPPKTRHVKHLDNKYVAWLIEKISFSVQNRRKVIYGVVIVSLIAAFIGISRLNTTGRMVDDIPKKDRMYTDLLFFEDNFNGVIPLEITIDTKDSSGRGVLKLKVLKRISKLQDTLATYPEFSRSLSIADVVKFGKQAFYNGNPDFYALPSSNEMMFMSSYIPKLEGGKNEMLRSYVDSSMRVTRISVQMANIGTPDIERITDDLRPKIDSIFKPSKYDVEITGMSIVFLKGTDYLVKNLATSLVIAILAIALIMALLFSSARMVIVSIIPNLIPLLLTGALMGYAGIPIKPSTILIFSIALGISVDNAIHYLARYRHALKLNNNQVRPSVIMAIEEMGTSIIYSSIVLFFGFFIFTFSSFGGTEAMGLLVSFTLLIAVLLNMFFLPSLIMSLDKYMANRHFRKSAISVIDEGEDEEIDLDENSLS